MVVGDELVVFQLEIADRILLTVQVAPYVVPRIEVRSRVGGVGALDLLADQLGNGGRACQRFADLDHNLDHVHDAFIVEHGVDGLIEPYVHVAVKLLQRFGRDHVDHGVDDVIYVFVDVLRLFLGPLVLIFKIGKTGGRPVDGGLVIAYLIPVVKRNVVGGLVEQLDQRVEREIRALDALYQREYNLGKAVAQRIAGERLHKGKDIRNAALRPRGAEEPLKDLIKHALGVGSDIGTVVVLVGENLAVVIAVITSLV